jgi:O-antigen/teichoic acid export membrane protein
MTAGLAARAVIQAAYLVLVSRWLGASGYGLFSGCIVVGVLAAPLAGWGMPAIVVREVASDRSHVRGWMARGLQHLLGSGAMLAVVVALIMIWGMHTRLPMRLLAVSEVILLPTSQMIGSTFLALGQATQAALNYCVVPLVRLLAVVPLLVYGSAADPSRLATIHFGASLFGAMITLYVFAAVNGWPDWRHRPPLRHVARDGTGFALGTFVSAGYPEVDKVLLLQILGASAAGNYTAAYRVMSVLVMPINALLTATLPRLFALREEAPKARMLKHAIVAALGYASLAAIAAAIGAPLMPKVFGAGFGDSTSYLWMLAPWPLVFALHQVLATGLTAYDRQFSRLLIDAGGVVMITTLNLLFAKTFGVTATAMTLLSAEAAMACACWLVMRRRRAV